MTVIGIDPGVTGAVAVIMSGMRHALVFDTPTAIVEGTKKDKTIYMPSLMLNVLKTVPTFVGPVDRAFIEKIVAMPRKFRDKHGVDHEIKMGATSMIGYGYGYGLWIGILTSLGIPYTEVMPLTWKKALMPGASRDKQLDIDRALQLYPGTDIKLKKHHGRADAVLIAHYGKMILGQ